MKEENNLDDSFFSGIWLQWCFYMQNMNIKLLQRKIIELMELFFSEDSKLKQTNWV